MLNIIIHEYLDFVKKIFGRFRIQNKISTLV